MSPRQAASPPWWRRAILQRRRATAYETQNRAPGAFYGATEALSKGFETSGTQSAKVLLKRAVGLGDSPKAQREQSFRTAKRKRPGSGREQAPGLMLDQEITLEKPPSAPEGLVSRLQDQGRVAYTSRRSKTLVGGVRG